MINNESIAFHYHIFIVLHLFSVKYIDRCIYVKYWAFLGFCSGQLMKWVSPSYKGDVERCQLGVTFSQTTDPTAASQGHLLTGLVYFFGGGS